MTLAIDLCIISMILRVKSIVRLGSNLWDLIACDLRYKLIAGRRQFQRGIWRDDSLIWFQLLSDLEAIFIRTACITEIGSFDFLSLQLQCLHKLAMSLLGLLAEPSGLTLTSWYDYRKGRITSQWFVSITFGVQVLVDVVS